jgi:hypothetical protein
MNMHATLEEPVSIQQISKTITIEVLLETVFYIQSVQSGYVDSVENWQSNTRVEAGSNTSTVTLRVIGSDEKGSLESETVKYGHESYGTRTRK